VISPHNPAWSKIGCASARPIGVRAMDGAQQRREQRKEIRARVKNKNRNRKLTLIKASFVAGLY